MAMPATLLPILLALAAAPAGAPLKVAEDAVRRGEPERAIAALQDAPQGLLEDYRALLLGTAYLSTGKHGEAQRWLSSIPKTPREALECKPACKHPLWEPAAEALAQALETSSATRAATLLLELPPTGARLARAAELWSSAKQPERARAAEQRLLIEAPQSSEAKALATALGAKGVRDRLGTKKRRMERIRTLLATHENEAARTEARALLSQKPGALECELRYVEGKASRKLRDYSAALQALPRARATCAAAKDTTHALASTLLEIQVRSIRGQLAEVGKLTAELVEKHGDHSYADDALLALGQLQERRGKAEQARATYQKILDRYPGGDQAAEAGWWLGFEAIRRGDGAAARETLARVASAKWRDSMDQGRVLFWLARLDEDDPEVSRDAVCKRYREAVFTPGLTFYSFLSISRLERTQKDCAKALRTELLAAVSPEGKPAPLPSLADRPPYRRARALAAIGLGAFAAKELQLLEHRAMTEQEALALALAHHESGAHFEAQTLLRRHGREVLHRAPSPEHRRIWEAAYSRPFSEEIAAAAKESKIDPLLLTALSREESTFDPEIVSWAGAVGLAQLMPATAIGAAAALGLGKLELERLIDPALNLRLGAHVLRSGLKRFGDRVPLALAAYNGGPGLTQRTLPSEAAQPFELWVESVPVRETRRYVQRVAGTWGIYRLLYDQTLIELPEIVPPR